MTDIYLQWHYQKVYVKGTRLIDWPWSKFALPESCCIESFYVAEDSIKSNLHWCMIRLKKLNVCVANQLCWHGIVCQTSSNFEERVFDARLLQKEQYHCATFVCDHSHHLPPLLQTVYAALGCVAICWLSDELQNLKDSHELIWYAARAELWCFGASRLAIF